jgi:two-component system chemotaxis sensor kinase CheA
MDDGELDEVVSEFITESHENLDQLDQELVELEQHPDPDVIARIFRTIHTIKGTSGFLGFNTLEAITHVGENLLSKLRDGDLSVTREITTALLAMVDAVRDVLRSVETDGTEGGATYGELVETLERLDRGEAVAPDGAVAPVRALHVIDGTGDAGDDPSGHQSGATEIAVDDDADAPIGERFIRAGLISQDQLDSALDRQAAGDPRHVGELLVEQAAVSPTDVVEGLKAQHEDRSPATESIRVDVGLLDDLMNLVGELVLARNQILQFTQTRHDAAFNATSQRLNLITTELQEGVMKTRMQPIENVWNKFPRVVRDLSVTCGKQARLVMEGKHTELDKTLLEAIKDPLTHLVRNAVDHGLESPERRVAAGKPAEGVITLRSYHEGGQVIIEIADDGAGIDPAVIRDKAVQKGLLTHDEALTRSDRDIVSIIFEPGFSTATTVSNISGRGVGMDVVRTNIESIGGSVDVQSVVGSGTTFKVKIPLTLAIIPALLVSCGGDRYAIPQVSLLELVHASGREGSSAIEHVHGAPVFRLRGRLLPLVFLAEVLGQGRPAGIDDGADINIVVLQADDQQFGLVVDHINDTAEIVVKPLGRLLKQATAFSGATIMGDGNVALILDVVGLAHSAQVGSTSSRTRAESSVAETEDTTPREAVLLVGVGERRFVLPLAAVARLEELPADSVREAGHQRVVHYRDAILPLVHLGEQLGVPAYGSGAGGNRLQVLVCGTGQRQVGLVVDVIHDIAEDHFVVTPRTSTVGIRGTAVVQGEVTDVLDLEALVHDVAFAIEEVAA